MTLTLASDMTVTLGKSEPDVDTPIMLHKGPNLIGYLPKENDSIQHAFSSIDGQYTWAHGYSGEEGPKTWDANRPGFLNDLHNLQPHYGYWIRLKDDVEKAELVYPTEGYAPTSSIPTQTPVDISFTPYFCDFWSVATILDGQPVQIGDVITAKDPEGTICGVHTVEHEGAYLLHVYGDDPTTPDEDEGADDGDVITFYINERPVATRDEPIWSLYESVELELCELVDWDVNGDCIIDISDLVVVAKHFGEKPPTDPRADVNGDGVVDISDLVLIVTNFD